MRCCPLLQSSLWGRPALSYGSCLIEKPAWQGIEINLWSVNLRMWGAQFNSWRSWILSTNMAVSFKVDPPQSGLRWLFSLPQHLNGYSARDLEAEEPSWSPPFLTLKNWDNKCLVFWARTFWDNMLCSNRKLLLQLSEFSRVQLCATP